MPTLDYQSHPPHLARRPGGRLAIVALVLLPAVMIGGGWFFARRPLLLPTPPLPPPPPTYYQSDELIALPEFQGWSILKHPTVPGPYAVLDDLSRVQSAPGCPVMGWIKTPRGLAPFDEPGIPDTSMQSVGVVNPAGQYDFFVLSRYEKPQGAASRPATNP